MNKRTQVLYVDADGNTWAPGLADGWTMAQVSAKNSPIAYPVRKFVQIDVIDNPRDGLIDLIEELKGGA